MYTNPHIGGERQRDMLARAEHRRDAQRLRLRSKAARRAEQAEQHPGWALRTLARLRMVIPRAARQPNQAEAAGGPQPPG